ncbi:MAG: nucleotidyltransferase domain-containing protein [Promethearchaeota archaeon]
MLDRMKKIFSDKEKNANSIPDQCIFRNLDYLETVQGDFWTVVGNEHPKNKVIAFIKYKRAGQTKQNDNSQWTKDGVKYERALPYYSASQVVKTFDALTADYVFFDEKTGINMSCVPHERIKRHYLPTLGLRQLQATPTEDLDPLQSKLLDLVEELSSITYVPKEKFGVTGSILIALHNPNISDLDLVVTGDDASYKIRESLKNEIKGENFSRIDSETYVKSTSRKAEVFDIPEEIATIFTQRRWNYGVYQQTRFSIHPVKEKSSYSYEDSSFSPLGEAKVLAEITDVGEALFYPPKWKIEIKEILNSTKSANSFAMDLTELVSYEGFYLDVFNPGESVEITGKVEKVSEVHKEDSYRILVGGVGAPSKIILKENKKEK